MMKTEHFMALCDDTGMFQHAVRGIPDRAHGYCVDDNARALLVAVEMEGARGRTGPEALETRFCAFIQHAWNPDLRRFRNFMGFDRRWLEDAGSEDSHGRTLWALGICARESTDPSRRAWASDLFSAALPTSRGFTSPRAWAFTLLGLDGYCAAAPADASASRMRGDLAGRLLALLNAVRTPDWLWFEDGLAYDNARLPQALLVTGHSLRSRDMTAAGLESLAWLAAQQTSPSGQFRPVGSQSFGDRRMPPRPFDQQPLESAATIAACRAAITSDVDSRWIETAQRAFEWYHGANDLGVPLVDRLDGSCRDGLHPDRANENRGAESVVSYLLACLDMRRLASVTASRINPVRLRA
jgi:hypothetical protein